MSAFTGTGTLTRLAFRRDRLRLGLWALGIVGVSAASASAVQTTYNTPAKMTSYATTAGTSAASRITSGRQVALDTIDGITANEITLIVTLGITLLVVFTVIRHTRAEEESGAAELVRAGVVGRHAAQATALIVALSTALVISALLVVVLIGLGSSVTGSIAFGAEVAMLGLLFAGLAAAAAQITASARGALGIAGGLLGAAYVVRGVGAVADNWLYWTSPFGWAQGVNAYGDERWWLLGVLLLGACATFGLAAFLVTRRDAGAGLIQPRLGSAHAGAALGRPEGMAWRTQRGLIIGWAIGLLALAAIYGSVIPEVPAMFEANPDLLKTLGLGTGAGEKLILLFLGYINLTLGVIGAVYGVASVMRLRAEEDSGRLELLLATPTSRFRWLAGTLSVTLGGIVLMAVAMGLGMVVGYVPVAKSSDPSITRELFLGLIAQLPAMLLVAAVAFALLAWVRRFPILPWVYLIWVVLEAFVGQTLKLPSALRGTSPFFHLPAYPGDPWSSGPCLVLLGITVVVTVLGFVGYRRRDLG